MNNQLSFIQEPLKSSQLGYTLHIDGASRNNPGPAGAGIVVKLDDKLVLTHGYFLGNKTNNQAEYLALVLGLITWKSLKKDKPLYVFSDSELLVRQLTGQYRVKNPALQHLFHCAYLLTNNLPIQFTHVLRAKNKEADALANQGIDTKSPIPDHYRKVLDEYRITI